MSSDATIVATLDHWPATGESAALPREVGWLEVRADLTGDLDAAMLRRSFHGSLLYVLRSAPTLSQAERRTRLMRAADSYDLVELEPCDLVPRVLAAIPPSRRVIAWYGGPTAIQCEQIFRVEARLYRIVTEARRAGDELPPLELQKSLNRADVVAYASGPIGFWTRIVALQLGARFVFAPGGIENLPSVAQLIADYGLPRIHSAAALFAIAGDPVFGSLSPRLHNAAFRVLGHRALYVPFHVPDFCSFWTNVIENHAVDALGLPIRAICVVSPHKDIAVAAAKSRTRSVQRAASTNFFLREGDTWTADSTDPEGVTVTLREHGVSVARERVAVVGCGGAGRMVAAALQEAGADVTLVNRGFDRGSLAVRLLHLPFQPLAGFSPERYSIVVNATPLGRDGESPPFALAPLRHDAVVVDLVYGDKPTPLIASRRAAGQIAIDGRQVLLAQAERQFHLMTGREMPHGLARDVLGMDVEREPVAAEA
jgi:3-dehydroquinate dehydratase/shikimate dehydrogenase